MTAGVKCTNAELSFFDTAVSKYEKQTAEEDRDILMFGVIRHMVMLPITGASSTDGSSHILAECNRPFSQLAF